MSLRLRHISCNKCLNPRRLITLTILCYYDSPENCTEQGALLLLQLHISILSYLRNTRLPSNALYPKKLAPLTLNLRNLKARWQQPYNVLVYSGLPRLHPFRMKRVPVGPRYLSALLPSEEGRCTESPLNPSDSVLHFRTSHLWIRWMDVRAQS